MFETLSQGFSNALEKLTKQGVLREDEISTALREVRIALLEADVSLEITKRFVKSVGEKARGQAVTKSVTPGQQVIKIVHDELIKVLEGHSETSNALKIDNPPATILMVGLQGSGKTTTSAKLALRLQNKEKKKVLLASLDTRRPAAMEQLEILGKSNSIDTLPIVKNQSPEQITSRAMQQASLGGYDVIILDSAGRMQIDDELMTEIEKIKDLSNPNETLLIADSRPITIVSRVDLIPYNMSIFTATSNTQTSGAIKEQKHGLFTYFLLKGLRGDADIDEDKKLTLFELSKYIKKKVSSYALNADREQTPQLQGDDNRVLVEFN